uniref:Serine and arginine rich splicing factor 4 n=1 Tax=Molossus molossus TaxID=27622 RepID=A0A7J8FBZ5_MOLMO|nr:serine and arginine rich splicing factor 4 [Molossus molossus]
MPRVYIGRLSYQARERDVERFFKGYGKILEVDLKNGLLCSEPTHVFGRTRWLTLANGNQKTSESNLVVTYPELRGVSPCPKVGKDQVQTELWPTFADQESTLALIRELLVCRNCQFADVKRAPDWVLVSPGVAPQLCHSVSTATSLILTSHGEVRFLQGK